MPLYNPTTDTGNPLYTDSCLEGEFLYYRRCKPNICFDDLKALAKSGPSDTVVGAINPALYLEIQKTNDGLITVNIYQYEKNVKRMIEQPECINVKVYQNVAKDNIKRLSLNADGTPAWPAVTSKFDPSAPQTIRSFQITVSDMQTKLC